MDIESVSKQPLIAYHNLLLVKQVTESSVSKQPLIAYHNAGEPTAKPVLSVSKQPLIAYHNMDIGYTSSRKVYRSSR